MREDRYSAHTPAIRDLFAERQVYVRAGMTSRYVTISRALQISATLGVAMLVAWLGLASYAAVAKHLEAVAQGREVARLEAVTKALQAKIEAAQADRSAPAVAPASDLALKLAEAKAARDRALTLTKASAAEIGRAAARARPGRRPAARIGGRSQPTDHRGEARRSRAGRGYEQVGRRAGCGHPDYTSGPVRQRRRGRGLPHSMTGGPARSCSAGRRDRRAVGEA